MTDKTLTKEEYNDVPVHYCKKCLSLAIKRVDGMDYCEKCGGTETWVTLIDDWIALYKDAYNKNFLNLKPKNYGE